MKSIVKYITDQKKHVINVRIKITWSNVIFGHTGFDLMALLFKFFHSLLKAKVRLEKMALTYWKGTVLDYPKSIELLHLLKNILPSTGIEVKLSRLCVMMC